MKLLASLVGLERLTANLSAVGHSLSGANLGRAAQAGSKVILVDTQRRVPVRTGALRDSYGVELVEASLMRAIADTGSSLEYAPFVELGTSRMSAQPHLRPATDENHSRIEKAVGDSLKGSLESVRIVLG